MLDQLPEGVRFAPGVEIPPESLALLHAERALRRSVRTCLRGKARSRRTGARREMGRMIRESMTALGEEIDRCGVERVTWEVTLPA